jgi:hypothetical protein
VMIRTCRPVRPAGRVVLGLPDFVAPRRPEALLGVQI